MSNTSYFIYLLIMVGVTYLIRAIPFCLITKKIENVTIRSFLAYIPYAVLTAMTIPAVFYAADHIVSSIVGFAAAVLVSLRSKSLTLVALLACAAVFVTELVLTLI